MGNGKRGYIAAKRIFAIEDEQDILDLYTYLFKDAGYKVSTSLTGENVLGQIHPSGQI